MTTHYEPEALPSYYDDGTMPNNVEKLAAEVVGHRIIKAEKRNVQTSRYWYGVREALFLTLDDGRKVYLADTDDCCAYTQLESFLLHPEMVDHVITGVGTTDGFTTWHIYADLGDILTMNVDWSCGNPFYYGYGFDIAVKEADRIEREAGL